ncbi:hypothetical protein [Achromobacter insolitus]|uniref:hypothetical protein n=1 Tax=Achromobacter insolitus TaxID=217204 RepID=UPI0020A54510|nr:hypothetical protein [Achromobacter insolitus]MCP1404605.1 hypothetical protein [Achromobacter insolitus]
MGEKKPKKPFYKSWSFWLILIVVVVAVNRGDKNGGNSAAQPAMARPAPPQPEQQRLLVQTVVEAQGKGRATENDMQLGGIKAARDKQLCSQMKSRAVKDWIGTVQRVGANSDGKGVLSIEIADKVAVKTWNNAFSDTSHKTMLEPGTALFNTAASLKKGQLIKFSGTFFNGSSGDCLAESSLSLSGKVQDPEFLFRFSAIEPL